MIRDRSTSNAWERIELIMKLHNVNARTMSLMVGCASQSLYIIKSGKQGLGYAIASKICQCFPEINMNWLLYGKGEMLVEDMPSLDHSEPKTFKIVLELSRAELLIFMKITQNIYHQMKGY